MSNSSPVGPMGFLGTPKVGNTLTARPNSIEDADGINTNTDSFQWLRNGEPIPGATGQFYEVQAADLDAQISVSYLYADLLGTREVVTSKPKTVEPADVSSGPTAPLPTASEDDGYKSPNNSAPEGPMGVLGDALVGNTLTARPNAIKDADGIDYNSAGFQWLRDGQEIAGADEQTYVVTDEDRGTQISVAYTYSDFGGSYERVISTPEPTVPGGTPPETPTTPEVPDTSEEPDNPETPDIPAVPETPTEHINSGPVGNVFILGFPIETAELLARLDALYDRDHILENTGRFQWLRDGEPIDGATNKTYTVSAEDRGAVLSVQYTYTDGYGTVETVVSDPEPPVRFPDGMEPEGREDSDDTPDPAVEDLEGETPETTPEDDVVTITSAMSRIDGLEGTDTAVLAGDQTDYTVTFGPDGVSVTDRTADGLGTVELTNFEFLDFGNEIPMFDGPMDLTQFGGHTGLGEAEFSAFVEMYIAYFNRAPDAVGLAFWGTAFANGMSMEDIASEFADQPETLAAYPADLSSIRFTADVYENVLGRSPDLDGLRFWTEALDSGAVGRGELILEVLEGAKAAPPADASQAFIDRQAADQAYLEAKTDLGALFAVHRGMSNLDDASMIMEMFDGSAESLALAAEAVDTLYTAAQVSVNGDFLMPLVGVLDDPFAI